MDAPAPSSTPPVPATPETEAAAPVKSPEQVAKEVLDEHEVRVFRPSTVRFNPRLLDLPDDFFQPTGSELVEASHQLTAATHRLQDAPMMTKKMRDAETEKRMSRYRKVLLRILFQDRIAIQGMFKPQDNMRKVVRFVRAALLDARNVKFYLFMVPPKKILSDPKQTLWAAGLCPAAIVHIGIDEGPKETSALLKPWLLERIEDAPESRTAPPPAPEPAPTVPAAQRPGPSTQGALKKKSLVKKIPKWFKK